MAKHVSARILCGSFVMVCADVLPAHADLSIAKMPTSNVSCTGASCGATAATAVLNVADLRHLLAKYPAVSVDAAVASNMTVDATLSWTSTASLALTASGSLIVNKPVTVAGDGSLAIQTADSGLSFAPNASISFWSLSSALTINTVAYMLVGDVKTLNGFNFYLVPAVAFARDYDASADGTYNTTIDLPQGAHLEGLGHTISHLTAEGTGLIDILQGTLTNLHLANTIVFDPNGGVVRTNSGLMDHVSMSGELQGWGGVLEVGGLVGENGYGGIIRNSWAKVKIPVGGYTQTGGLVATNYGTISNSWTDGTVRGFAATGMQGALVGFNGGTIENSYSLADTRFCSGCKFETAHGGLLGETSSGAGYPSKVVSSYAAGATARDTPLKIGPPGEKIINFAGSVVGLDGDYSTFGSTYWVIDSSKHNPKLPAGNKARLAGVAGLTQAQLKSTLPLGFDATIWGQSPDINNGYPYLLSNPPQ